MINNYGCTPDDGKPSIPADIRDRVKWYFGMRLEHG